MSNSVVRPGMLAIGLAVAVVAGALPAVAQENREPNDDGLRLGVDATYELDLEEGAIGVTLNVAATNTIADRTDEFGVTRFYFDELILMVPIEAENVTASAAGRPIEVVVTPSEVGGVSEVSIPLAPRLYSGSTRELSVAFALSGDPPRSGGELRVNRAFAWFYVWAYGDPGRSSVSVLLDEALEVEILGDHLVRTVDESGRRLLHAGEIEDPDAWVAVISARDDRALKRSTVRVADSLVALESWPGDSDWAGSVADVLGAGIPALEALTGLEWDTDLRVVQSFGPSIRGYTGGYREGVDEIEIGEEIDAHQVLREASHAWFNEDLFAQRWITEGLADGFTALAIDRLGWEGQPAPAVLASVPGDLALNDWGPPTFDGRTIDRTDDLEHAASWQLIDVLIGETGADGMAAVVDAAASDLIAYRSGPEAEIVDPVDDWRRFLDLAEEVGGAVGAGDMFAEWVVADEHLDLLTQRETTRLAYGRLESDAGTWGLPLELRTAMSDWEFATALHLISSAAEVLDARSRLESSVEAAGVAPPTLESRFEDGEDAEILVAELAAQVLVLDELAAARVAVGRPRSMMASVGLWGADPSAHLDAATDAVSEGDLEAAQTAASLAESMVAQAERDGSIRLGAATVVLGLLVVVALVRRRRSRLVVDDEPAEVASI